MGVCVAQNHPRHSSSAAQSAGPKQLRGVRVEVAVAVNVAVFVLVGVRVGVAVAVIVGVGRTVTTQAPMLFDHSVCTT